MTLRIILRNDSVSIPCFNDKKSSSNDTHKTNNKNIYIVIKYKYNELIIHKNMENSQLALK